MHLYLLTYNLSGLCLWNSNWSNAINSHGHNEDQGLYKGHPVRKVWPVNREYRLSIHWQECEPYNSSTWNEDTDSCWKRTNSFTLTIFNMQSYKMNIVQWICTYGHQCCQFGSSHMNSFSHSCSSCWKDDPQIPFLLHVCHWL